MAALAQRVLDAVSARDLDAAMSFYDPHAVFDTVAAGVGPFEGRVAIRGFFEDWIGTFDDYEHEAEEIRDLGNGVTLAVILQRGRPPGGTGWVQIRYAAVTTWVNGLIERQTRYTVDEGRAAAERLASSSSAGADAVQKAAWRSSRLPL